MDYHIAPQARVDLKESWRHVAVDSENAADRLFAAFLERFQRLGNHSMMDEQRPDLGEGIRQFTVASYIVFYRPQSTGIEVVRVVHGSRDIPALFRKL